MRFYEECRSTDSYCPHSYTFFKLCFRENYCTGKKFSPFTKPMGNGFNSVHLSDSFLDVLTVHGRDALSPHCVVSLNAFLLFPYFFCCCLKPLHIDSLFYSLPTTCKNDFPYGATLHINTQLLSLQLRHPPFLAVHKLLSSEDAGLSHCSFLCLLYCWVTETIIFSNNLPLSK